MGSPSLLQRHVLPLSAALLLCTVLAGCSSAAPAPSSPATGSTSAAEPSAAATPSAAAPPSTPAPAQSDAAGTITFKGKVTGTMTVSACPGGGVAQLTVNVKGDDSTYTGIIDADDFTFIGPSSTAYTLAKGASKPQISGKTYTVKDTKLVGVTSEGTVTATGSVTCP